MICKPNFFIVGAPKCGTTSMSEYLRSHPYVFMSRYKEPNFFSSDLGLNRRSLDQYLHLFADAEPRHRIVAEASTTYLFSREALPRLKEFNSDAKLMVMLRQPSDLAYAIHGQCVLAGLETETDFKKAWDLQSARAAGKYLPPACPSSNVLQYKWMASIGSQVANLFQIFPRTHVHIVLLDDLAADPKKEYLRLLFFLGLPDDGKTDFPRVNEAKSYRWLWLGQTPRILRRYLRKPLFLLREKAGFQGIGLLTLLDGFNARVQPRPPMDPEFRRYLDDLFFDEVRLLEELLDRDLHSWRGQSHTGMLHASNQS